VLATIAGGVAAAYAAPAAAVLPGARGPGVVTRVPAAAEAVALTFDDGPHPRGTPAVLAALADLGLAATFFVVGTQAARRPGLVADIAAAGHEVALHGHRHLPHALLPPAAVRRDLERGLAAVEDAAGAPVTAVRAPYGTASLATVAFARRHGLVLAGWSRWGWDWTPWATPASIAAGVTGAAVAGDILLLHDSDAYAAPGSWRRTLAALPLVAERLAGRGLAARPLREVAAYPATLPRQG
jgi:peptidoglycan-N-acetylglucosamine deacetylase